MKALTPKSAAPKKVKAASPAKVAKKDLKKEAAPVKMGLSKAAYSAALAK